MLKPFLVPGIALVLVAAGCGPAPEDVVTAPPPATTVAFEGKVDAALAGTWKSTDGRSTMVLNADGTSSNQASIASPGGVKEVDSKGHWLTKDDTLLLQDQDKSTVLYYVKRVDPKTIELRRVKDSTIVITYKMQ